MSVEIRRTVIWKQLTFLEGWKRLDSPTLLVAAMAIIRNPWYGQGHVENLRTAVMEHGPVLGKILTDMLLLETDGQLEGCGKASVVGMGGEIEHAQALTHTLHFGNQLRKAVDAKSYLAFSNTRGSANCAITIPLMDKDASGRRSHYQTIQTSICDAPAPDEIVIALGASVGGHPNHRIGDRYQDLAEMGNELDNPAGI